MGDGLLVTDDDSVRQVKSMDLASGKEASAVNTSSQCDAPVNMYPSIKAQSLPFHPYIVKEHSKGVGVLTHLPF